MCKLRGGQTCFWIIVQGSGIQLTYKHLPVRDPSVPGLPEVCFQIWVCLKMLCTPKNPMVLLIIIPMKNGYFIGNINPTFSDIPICSHMFRYDQRDTCAVQLSNSLRWVVSVAKDLRPHPEAIYALAPTLIVQGERCRVMSQVVVWVTDFVERISLALECFRY